MNEVVHVIPTAVARGAQIHARALADTLDRPGGRHLVLCLFEGPAEVKVEVNLRCRGGRTAGAGFDPRVVRPLRAEIRSLEPQVLVAHGGDALKYALWCSRSSRVVFHAIGTLADPATSGARLALWRALARRSDTVVAVSQDVAAECGTLLRVRPDRLRVIPNGRSPELFHPAELLERARSEPVVLFLGRMTPGKRPEVFVEVVARLRSRGLEFRAFAVGDGPALRALRPSALSAGVELPGPTEDPASVLRGCDVLLFPSAPEGEGMPGVLIEAGLSGVAVVATDVPGVRSVVADGETGTIVALDDLEGLVEATAELLCDPGRRAFMGRRARLRCEERFSMKQSAAGWRSLLDELTGRR